MGTQSFIAAAIWYQYNCCDPNGDWGLTQGIGNYEPAWYAFAAQCGQVAPPVADFGAAPVSGLAPLDVQFTDLSIGLVDTYLWDFGDASTSGQANPSHQYTVPGTYTVSLTVTGPGGVDAETKVDYVTVAPQANPADLDGDGDADLTDFARFAGCYTGPGQTTPPPGCDTGTGTPSPAIHNYELAASLGALSDSITAGDLIDGVIGTQEAGGFHQAVPGGVPGGLADLTDGAVGSSLEAVLADYSRPALQVRYDFSPPRDIDHLHVFVANNDGRVFQDYDVSYSTDGDPLFQTLSDGVTTGPFGQVNAGAHGASLTRLVSSASGPIAVEVDALCFVFYDVSTVSPPNVFWDAYDAGEGGDTDGQPRAYVGSIVKEIDVFEYTGPPLPTNLADLDGDGDVNLTDLDAFDACLTGPGDDPGTPPPLPPGCV
ncbi:MAG: PKD domain-containing protein [bacterium]|nr:PKD domain-containing protein [bacterium]